MLDIDSNAYMLIYSLIVSHAYANLSVSVAIIRSHGECTVGQTKGCMAAVDRMTTTTLPAASTSITHNSGSATAHRLTSHPQSSTKLLQLLHRRSQIGCVVPLSTANLSRRLRRCRRAAFTHWRVLVASLYSVLHHSYTSFTVDTVHFRRVVVGYACKNDTDINHLVQAASILPEMWCWQPRWSFHVNLHHMRIRDDDKCVLL